MTTIPEARPVNFIDNPYAPEVFADAGAGFFLANGNLRIALESARVNHRASAGPVNRVVIARVVMPAHAAESLARGILDFLERMRAGPQEAAQRAPTFQ